MVATVVRDCRSSFFEVENADQRKAIEEIRMQSIQQAMTGVLRGSNATGSVASSLARPRTAASTAATSSTNASSAATASASGTATITANDFLTLLVAEMKNQDPTQPTDPNAYISQMVDVNSLQQLIGINQGITSLDTATGVSSTTGS
jgi:flagellar basal-body rod modification protein FlgD